MPNVPSRHTKPFNGIISQWRKDATGVRGIVMWHRLHDAHTTEFEPGHRIQTTPVVELGRIADNEWSLCETQNSFYVLLGKQLEDR